MIGKILKIAEKTIVKLPMIKKMFTNNVEKEPNQRYEIDETMSQAFFWEEMAPKDIVLLLEQCTIYNPLF